MKPRWQTIHASVPGGRHLTEGRPGQDASVAGVTAAGHTFVAVADGRGSSSCSEVGSQLLAHRLPALLETFSPTLARNLDEDASDAESDWSVVASLLLTRLSSEIVDEATRLGRNASDLESTLSFAVAGARHLAWASVGDSPLVAVSTGGIVGLLTQDDRKTNYAGETHFVGPHLIATTDALRTGRVRIDQIRAIFCATDGLADAFVRTGGAPTTAWLDLTRLMERGALTLEILTAVLSAEHWRTRPIDDDRSLALMVQTVAQNVSPSAVRSAAVNTREHLSGSSELGLLPTAQADASTTEETQFSATGGSIR